MACAVDEASSNVDAAHPHSNAAADVDDSTFMLFEGRFEGGGRRR